ncbi:ubiquinone anaerobic biosynthesis accessory factor UbiT [Porticoccus sp.]
MPFSLPRSRHWADRAEALVFPLLRLVPFAPQKILLEKLLNPLLAEALAEGELDFLADRSVAIHFTDLDTGWRIGCDGRQLQVMPLSGTADAAIRGRVRAFALLAAGRDDPDTLFFRRELSLEGDTELGLAVKNLLDSVELDTLPAPLRGLLAGASTLANSMA